ncbi:helix-turn-helix domain-containing protein [Streptomyces capitiformicae]|uniref:HTH cro/C1-type domain-containing protein n=1 Tax=Streptomyces capitiformicae TaxID=2014920 RepID=A0A919DKM1_9ACTN|nr:helix-turn-helix transcriptional regulator [Streptomyces capitiformicae]GHE51678.1 hypothetical protein GCM10017771_73980 [Streptomyces capitiformicae]
MDTGDTSAAESGPAEALAELRRRLADGLAHRGLDQTQVARATGLSRGTVNRALSANAAPPSKSTVSALARALGMDPQPLLDLLTASAGGGGDRLSRSLGRPVAEWDPLDLEVRPAAVPHTTAGEAPGAPGMLPGYVCRPHDEALARLVADAAAGRSRMAVLVGSSSTGKTRACWEAVQPLAAAGWRLWQPVDPTRAEAALDELARVGPQTVVWLDEAQHYLGAGRGRGERVAAALTTLLTDPSRGPVLVLGTLWNEYAGAFTALPHPGQHDAHPNVRALLAHRRIRVPEKFDTVALGAAQALAEAGDRQLAAALERAEDGRLAQELAGGPELLHRYYTASPPARAILEAAMDARRLGVGLHLPLAFLEAAVEDYLTDSELDALDDNWLEQALAELGQPVHGKLAPLRRVRPRRAPRAPGTPAPAVERPGPVYRLADYLEQHGRHERSLLCPPASFWQAAADHLTYIPDELARLSRAALDRLRLGWAFHLLMQAVCGDGSDSAQEVVVLAHYRAAASGESAGEAVVQKAAGAGHRWALQALGVAADPGAEGGVVGISDAGGNSLIDLAERAMAAGDLLVAEDLALSVASTGDPQGARLLARLQEESGRLPDPSPRSQEPLSLADTEFLRRALLRAEEERHQDPETLAARALEMGNPQALLRLAELVYEGGDAATARDFIHRAADAGATAMLSYLLTKALYAQVTSWWPYGLDPDGTPSAPW